MPELPEVEAARLALEEHIKGKLIVRAVVAEDPIVISGISPLQLQEALTGKRIQHVSRKGKNLWLELDESPWPSFQFGMSGAFQIKGVDGVKYKRYVTNDDEWPSKYAKVVVELENGLEFAFIDLRRFARVRLLDDVSELPKGFPPISELGLDAFLELPEEEDFFNSVLNKRGSIKALLLDQSFLSGIGNWVADEVLYQARIHPEQLASSLSREQCTELRHTIKKVLAIAVEAGADSVQYPEDWIFHSREKKGDQAPVEGHKIEFIKVGGRTSAYVPALQKLTGPLEVGKPARKRASVKKAKDASPDSDENNAKSTVKVGRKTRAKAKESEAEIADEDNSAVVTTLSSKRRSKSSEEEGTTASPLITGGLAENNTVAADQVKEVLSEKDSMIGVGVAASPHYSVGSGSIGSVIRGYNTTCNAKTPFSAGESSPPHIYFHRSKSFTAAGGVKDKYGYHADCFRNSRIDGQRRFATCSISTSSEQKARVNAIVNGAHVGRVNMGLRVCISLLKRPACLV